MKRLLILFFILFSSHLLISQRINNSESSTTSINIIVIGAHPDDCDIRFGGTAALLSKMGHKIKFLSVTNGDAGHQKIGGGVLAKRRRMEAKKAGKILGVEYDILDNHDGELLPKLYIRNQIIKKIREWDADVVVGPRPNDYHPDHRNTGILMQDAAYMVIVPNVVPDTPPLKKNPIFLYVEDRFKKPYPFRKDISVIIDEVIDQKIEALAAHESQMFEWLPWTNGIKESEIPTNPDKRLIWLKKRYASQRNWDDNDKMIISKWYHDSDLSQIKHVEFFEICEYGKQPTNEEIKKIFHFF
jgi:LmbE family N-acetylglucosaminyl deacetylase